MGCVYACFKYRLILISNELSKSLSFSCYIMKPQRTKDSLLIHCDDIALDVILYKSRYAQRDLRSMSSQCFFGFIVIVQ